MDPDNPIIQLCIQGTQAELRGQITQARALYQQAWAAAQDDFEACIAAHYVARHQESPEQRLYWNQIALDRANSVGDNGVVPNAVQEFYPSLYLNMGQSFELLGNAAEAQRYYALAAGLGAVHHTKP